MAGRIYFRSERCCTKWRQGGWHFQETPQRSSSMHMGTKPTQTELRQFTSWLGKRSYVVRVERLGIERIREIARENGKKGGRPPKKGEKP